MQDSSVVGGYLLFFIALIRTLKCYCRQHEKDCFTGGSFVDWKKLQNID